MKMLLLETQNMNKRQSFESNIIRDIEQRNLSKEKNRMISELGKCDDHPFPSVPPC